MRLFIIFSLFFSVIGTSYAEIDLTDSDQIRKVLGVDAYVFSRKLSNFKVVVIDKGFRGYEAGMKTLPPNTTVISKIEEYPVDFLKTIDDDAKKVKMSSSEDTNHGLRVAETFFSVLGTNGNGIKLYLVQAPTATPFEIAAKFADFVGANLVIHSQNFDFSNGDGKGKYDKAVNNFCRENEKSFWVNAAGNDNGMMYRGPVRFESPRNQEDQDVLLGKQGFLEFTINKNNYPLDILLTWNSFDEKEEGTERDLDLEILNEKNETVKALVDKKEVEAKSEKKQVFLRNKKNENEIDLPIEKVSSFPFQKGTYRIYVKAKSNNFTMGDELTVTLKPRSAKTEIFSTAKGKNIPILEFKNPSSSSILKSPADSKYAITVGTLSIATSLGPTSDGRAKPEVFLPEIPLLDSEGELLLGSSFSAAFFAGVLAVLKGEDLNYDRDQLLAYLKTLELPSQSKGVAKIEDVSVRDFNKVFPDVLSMVQSEIGATGNSGAVKIGKYPDGQYVIGLPYYPSQLKWFGDSVEADGNDRYEYFLLPRLVKYNTNQGEVSDRALLAFSRDTQKDGTADMQSYPWETKRENNSLKRVDYIELRKVSKSSELQKQRTVEATKVGRVWKTPTPKK